MGNTIAQSTKKPLTIHDLSVKVGEYRTINEGDPEMIEDPEFPVQMMHEALDRNNTIEGNVVRGTYVYYPNKTKPKMWIGNYKILNPEDILCEDIAAKIGMNEMQWKKYIQQKSLSTNEECKSEYYANFDYITSEQREKLKQIMNENSIEYPHETNYNMNGLNNTENDKQAFNQFQYKELQNCINMDPNEGGYPIDYFYEQDEEQIKKDFIEFNQNIYNCNNINNSVNENGDESYDPDAYIKQLNEEVNRIRSKQEHEIYQGQRQLMRNENNTNIETYPEHNALMRNRISESMMKNIPEYIQYIDEDKMTEILRAEQEQQQMEQEQIKQKHIKEDTEDEQREEEEEEEEEEEKIEEEIDGTELAERSYMRISDTTAEIIKSGEELDVQFESAEQYNIKKHNPKDVTFSKNLPKKSYKSLATMSTKTSFDLNDRVINNVKGKKVQMRKSRFTKVMT